MIRRRLNLGAKLLALLLMIGTVSVFGQSGPDGIVSPTGTNPDTGSAWTDGDMYQLIFLTRAKTG